MADAVSNDDESGVRILLPVVRWSWECKFGSVVQVASRDGHVGILQLLLETGSEIAEEDYQLALRAAGESGHDEVIQLLTGY
jgi:hypothetical protein